MNSVYLGDYRAMTVTVFDKKIFVDTRDIGIAPHLLAEGRWEHWITNAMSPLLRGSMFIDVGANFGWYSLLADVMEARKIVALEPNPRTFELLTQTMMVNGTACELHAKAAGEERTEIDLHIDWGQVGGATLLKEHEGWEKVPVEVIPLDGVLGELFEREPQLGSASLVMKIDVEGYEPRAVLGAQSVLRNHTSCTAFVEYHSDSSGNGKLADMLTFFRETRYQMTHVNHEAKLVPLAAEQLDQLPDAEMLCFQRFPG